MAPGNHSASRCEPAERTGEGIARELLFFCEAFLLPLSPFSRNVAAGREEKKSVDSGKNHPVFLPVGNRPAFNNRAEPEWAPRAVKLPSQRAVTPRSRAESKSLRHLQALPRSGNRPPEPGGRGAPGIAKLSRAAGTSPRRRAEQTSRHSKSYLSQREKSPDAGTITCPPSYGGFLFPVANLPRSVYNKVISNGDGRAKIGHQGKQCRRLRD